MSHPPNAPLFYTITSTNCYDGNTSTIGIFDSMRAVAYRLQRCYSTCGDEYHIDCYHLSTAEKEKEEFIEQQTNRAKYQRENEIKERLYQEQKDNNGEDDEELTERLREERLNVA